MGAKDYLSRLSRLRAELQRKKETVESLDSILRSPAVTEVKHDKVRSSVTNKQEELILKKLEMENEVKALSVKTAELMLVIEKQINAMDNPVFSQLLHLRYLKYDHDVSLDIIAAEMHYEYNYVKVLHGEALRAFEKKYLKYISRKR